MKLLVFSDSHGRTLDMLSCIDEECPDVIFHLGDMVRDVEDIRSVYPDIPLYHVCGNNDWRSDAPETVIVTLGGVRFFLTHGHLHRVRSTTKRLASDARSHECQVALFGHTHITHCKYENGVLVANPGSISLPYREAPSYLRIIVENGTAKPEHVWLEDTQGFRFF